MLRDQIRDSKSRAVAAKVAMEYCIRFAILFLFCVAISCGKITYKSLMGSPSEFPQHVTPSPYDSAVSSLSYMPPWASISVGNPYVTTFEVDAVDYVTVAVVTESASDFQLMKMVVSDPNRNEVTPTLQTNESIGMDGLTYPTLTMAFVQPMAGQWCIVISTSCSDVKHAAVLVGYSGSLIWHSAFDTHELLTGNTINVYAVATDQAGLLARQSGQMPKSMENAIVEDASVTLFNPNDTTCVKKMEPSLTDNGDNAKTLLLTIQPTVAGTYRMWTTVSGKILSGDKSAKFQRSSWMIFRVVDKSLRLTGNAHIHREHFPLLSHSTMFSDCQKPHFWVAISVEPEASVNKVYRVYGQVWGKHFIVGSDVAVAWVSGMSDVLHDDTLGNVVSLRLDVEWLLKTWAFPPYSLRQVRIEEVDSFITVASTEDVKIEMSESLSNEVKDIVSTNGSKLEMCTFQSNYPLSNNSKRFDENGGKLILVHGYCAQERTFPESDFTDVAYFEDFKQSRTTDEFARLIQEFGDQFESFGLASHSHGGAASLHLYTYYESGLDKAVREIILLSVYSSVVHIS